jgi:hypothetical protein
LFLAAAASESLVNTEGDSDDPLRLPLRETFVRPSAFGSKLAVTLDRPEKSSGATVSTNAASFASHVSVKRDLPTAAPFKIIRAARSALMESSGFAFSTLNHVCSIRNFPLNCACT